jgi:predicted metal-dependent peptidase
MFTDGFIAGSWKNRSKPILWVITQGGNGNLLDWPGKKIVINK